MPILQAFASSRRLGPGQSPPLCRIVTNGFEKFSKLQVLFEQWLTAWIWIVLSRLAHWMLNGTYDVVSQLDLCRLTREQICVMARAGVVDLETDFGWPLTVKE